MKNMTNQTVQTYKGGTLSYTLGRYNFSTRGKIKVEEKFTSQV
ncbi:hypothetical protein [Pseudalkalibacillus decolorationis]|nr:hypothetical protein [Pseudalkalibacillus decolorationis]